MKAEQGFSLLELMIALAIFATLAAAVSSATHAVLCQNTRVQEKLLAGWIVDNHLIERRLQSAARPGRGEYELSMGGRRWWLFEVLEPAEPGLLLIEVAVRRSDSREVAHSRVSRVSGHHE